MENGNIFQCPCCGNRCFSERGGYEICPICLWEDDPLQSGDPTYRGGANKYSLIEARTIWLERHSICTKEK
ncbi:CPCC family cysteine-rich protein [Desulfovibrio desulfuricans]|uniref:CPCC family cysteine-rich protein n=1 Tax=Desulfovibrio desulfuricans TaxID=876 RepID=UPI001C00A00B|nr:hypothetical protein [Desulfovibrio desulfuricans]